MKTTILLLALSLLYSYHRSSTHEIKGNKRQTVNVPYTEQKDMGLNLVLGAEKSPLRINTFHSIFVI